MRGHLNNLSNPFLGPPHAAAIRLFRFDFYSCLPFGHL